MLLDHCPLNIQYTVLVVREVRQVALVALIKARGPRGGGGVRSTNFVVRLLNILVEHEERRGEIE